LTDILEKTLTVGAKEMGIALSSEMLASFKLYYEMLVEENKKFNLTAINGEREVAVKHFLDSLSCVTVLEAPGDYVFDIGAGAGFPGIPLKMYCPQIRLLLVDSVRKKTVFLADLAEKLLLERTEVKWGRAEDLGKSVKYREKADTVVSRAVAPLNVLVELCLPLLKVGGLFLAMKGPHVSEELYAGRRAVAVLGGKVEKISRINLPGMEAKRNILSIRKVGPTPDMFPRKPGIPAKRPIK